MSERETMEWLLSMAEAADREAERVRAANLHAASMQIGRASAFREAAAQIQWMSLERHKANVAALKKQPRND